MIVSIPFKRESLSKVVIDEKRLSAFIKRVSIPFKRESLSKVPTTCVWIGMPGRGGVSIPFKRESLSKDMQPKRDATIYGKFQFPSNGKVYPKTEGTEGLCFAITGFNSLQTGKSIQSHHDV